MTHTIRDTSIHQLTTTDLRSVADEVWDLLQTDIGGGTVVNSLLGTKIRRRVNTRPLGPNFVIDRYQDGEWIPTFSGYNHNEGMRVQTEGRVKLGDRRLSVNFNGAKDTASVKVSHDQGAFVELTGSGGGLNHSYPKIFSRRSAESVKNADLASLAAQVRRYLTSPFDPGDSTFNRNEIGTIWGRVNVVHDANQVKILDPSGTTLATLNLETGEMSATWSRGMFTFNMSGNIDNPMVRVSDTSGATRFRQPSFRRTIDLRALRAPFQPADELEIEEETDMMDLKSVAIDAGKLTLGAAGMDAVAGMILAGIEKAGLEVDEEIAGVLIRTLTPMVLYALATGVSGRIDSTFGDGRASQLAAMAATAQEAVFVEHGLAGLDMLKGMLPVLIGVTQPFQDLAEAEDADAKALSAAAEASEVLTMVEEQEKVPVAVGG